jgi:hypothetical protein
MRTIFAEAGIRPGMRYWKSLRSQSRSRHFRGRRPRRAAKDLTATPSARCRTAPASATGWRSCHRPTGGAWRPCVRRRSPAGGAVDSGPAFRLAVRQVLLHWVTIKQAHEQGLLPRN